MTASQIALPEYVRAAREASLSRVITMTNDKGGVGKTTLTTNLLGQYAAAGYRVLGVDLNRQANMSDDLGYRGSAIDDQGENLYEAIRRPGRVPLQAHQVRDGLFVVPGGTELTGLTSLVTTRMQDQGADAYLGLAAALAPIGADYDLVIIDSPPENIVLVDLALAAARWVIMPTKSDTGGVVGMKLVAERFAKAKQINPGLSLLGVVLFGTLSNATAIHEEVRADVRAAFGGHDPMLTATIRHSERVARNMRRQGKLSHELELDAAQQPAFWQALREGRKPEQRHSAATGRVSEDFRNVALEVLDIINAVEAPAPAEELA